ncbi:MAG TPA: Ig-like domain-containing protein [Verrucomicrobiae bacterium]
MVLFLGCLPPAYAATQLIANGSFTGTAQTPWKASGNGISFQNGFLEMGNAAGQSQTVYQTVTFPSNLIGATLSLAYDVASTDPNVDDFLSIYITTTNNASIEYSLGTVSSANVTGGYIGVSTNFVSYAGSNLISALSGQTVNLLFYVSTDPTYGNYTQFGITSVSLVAGTTADIPANDDFVNATLIPSAGLTNIAVTTYASREANEPDIAGNPGGHSLWWTWTSTALGTVAISTIESSFHTTLGVYAGAAIDGLSVVTNYDGINNSAGSSFASFPVTAGTQYYISVDGYNGQSGSTLFTLKFVPDKTAPALLIKSPLPGANVSNSTVVVTGTARDNVAVGSVQYRLLNADGAGAWQLASGTNSWSATNSDLIPGTNTVQVKAIDTSSNASLVHSLLLNYIAPSRLTLNKTGAGTVVGATNQQMLHVGYAYTLTAIPAAGFKFAGWTGGIVANTAALRFIMTPNLSLTASFADGQRPILSITAPKLNQRWSNDVFNVIGTAKDNVGVAAVWYQVNGGAWLSNVNSTNGFTNWQVNVPVKQGANMIKAYSQDAAGNVSLTNSASLIYVPSTTATFQAAGLGGFKPDYNNVLLAIHSNYTVTAVANTGYVFSNWTDSGGTEITNSAVLKFTMASNLYYIANFIPNPFLPAAGIYDGLFSGLKNALMPSNSGFFTATVGTNGGFTAKFQQGIKSYSVAGQFSLTGAWNTNALKVWNNTAIGLQLNLPIGYFLSGTLANSLWTANLGANQSVYSKTNPSTEAGQYTLVLPGSATAGQPGGNGFASVKVDALGNITLAGTLGDGTKVTQSAVESRQKIWPVYIPLNNGSGMILGSLELIDETDRDIDGLLNWFQPARAKAATYPAGFTNSFEVAGSRYSPPKGSRILDLTNGFALLQGAGLAQSISNQFFLAASDIVSGSNQLHLTLAAPTGLFHGTVTNGSGKTVTFSGAVLQKQTNGWGQFLNDEQTGSVYIAPR